MVLTLEGKEPHARRAWLSWKRVFRTFLFGHSRCGYTRTFLVLASHQTDQTTWGASTTLKSPVNELKSVTQLSLLPTCFASDAMARQKGVRVSRIPIHEDPPEHEHRASDVEETEDDAASVASELSAIKSDQSSEPEDIDESVAEDIERFHESFMGIQDRYRLINRIGEGMFPCLTLNYVSD